MSKKHPEIELNKGNESETNPKEWFESYRELLLNTLVDLELCRADEPYITMIDLIKKSNTKEELAIYVLCSLFDEGNKRGMKIKELDTMYH